MRRSPVTVGFTLMRGCRIIAARNLGAEGAPNAGYTNQRGTGTGTSTSTSTALRSLRAPRNPV